MMTTRQLLVRAALGMLALFAVACSATSSATLTAGMTPAQTVQALGEPDLKDNVADPTHSGATVLRYVWLEPGKAAIFGSDDRLASIQNVEGNTKQNVEQEAHEQQAVGGPQQVFDPIQTPLDYFFYPVKAGAIYLGAGLNCVGGGGCEKPHLPSPSAG